MSAALAKKKPDSKPKTEVRSSQEWMDRVDRHAQRMEMTRSAYIRFVVTRAMDAEDEAAAARAQQKPKA